MTELPLRPATGDDWDAVATMIARAFHHTRDPDAQRAERDVVEPERCLLAEDAGTVVAHAGAYTRELTVPGAVLPAAHVTLVSVAATHRRRRLLSRMMHRQLREVRDAGRESLAVLWASEGRIYPRFGYGLAAQQLHVAADTVELRIAGPDPVGLRTVDPGTGWRGLAAVHDALRPHRPGWSSRNEAWWRFVVCDTPARRRDGTALQAVVTDDGSGYALWRTRTGWAPTGPRAEVEVREVVAGEPAAYATLWRFLLGIDLCRSVTYPFAAVDDALLHLVDEPRRLGTGLAESLWVRLVDLPRALAARRYAAALDVVFEVRDELLPENAGRWRLAGGPQGATCSATDDPADLVCDVRDLGSAYLGGTSLAALAAAGRVEERVPGTLGPAATAFRWHRLPAATEVF